MSRELQTGSTGVAVEAVPEREVSCLSQWLQTCATAVGCSSGTWAWKFLFATAIGCSCGTWLVARKRNRGASGLVDSFLFWRNRYYFHCAELIGAERRARSSLDGANFVYRSFCRVVPEDGSFLRWKRWRKVQAGARCPCKLWYKMYREQTVI